MKTWSALTIFFDSSQWIPAGRSCLRTGLHRSEQEHHSWRQEPWLKQKHPGLSCADWFSAAMLLFFLFEMDWTRGDNDESLMLWLFHVMFPVIPLSSSSSQQQRKETVNMWFCLHPCNPWAFDNISTHPGLLLLRCSWKMMEHGQLCVSHEITLGKSHGRIK